MREDENNFTVFFVLISCFFISQPVSAQTVYFVLSDVLSTLVLAQICHIEQRVQYNMGLATLLTNQSARCILVIL